MIWRPQWLERIRRGWSDRPIVWLSGVRRVGKTTLAGMVPDIAYHNCDLPSTARALADPELFLSGQRRGAVLALDEVHRLPDPSLTLKIAADEYPHLRILATGSSTLAATGKFRDSLTGRKRAVHLCPVLWEECADTFGITDLDRRLLHGGLPEALLAETKSPHAFAEWIDSFYARDILELFSIRNRQGFLGLFRLLMRWSGGQVDYTRLSRLTEVSRPTVKSYLEALQIAHAVHLLRPFRGGGSGEIVSRPKCYAFDTGSSHSSGAGTGSGRRTADSSGNTWYWTRSGSVIPTSTSSTGVTSRGGRSTSWFVGRKDAWTPSSARSTRMKSARLR